MIEVMLSFLFIFQTMAIVYLFSKVAILHGLLNKTIDFTYTIHDTQNNTSQNLLELIKIINGRYKNEN